MQAIASLSRGVGVALQGVVRGVVRNQSNTEPARAGGPEAADSRLGNKLIIWLSSFGAQFSARGELH